MILTVTPNPAVDATWHLDTLTPGASHRVDPGTLRAGGKGVNVARVLHGTGYEVLALVSAGGQTGAIFAQELACSRIPAEIVPVAAATRLSIALVEGSGAATVVNERGRPLTDVEFDDLVTRIAARAASAGVVVISGSLPAGLPADALIRLIAAVPAGIPLIVDTSGPGLLAAADAGVTVLKPNRDEAIEATGEADPILGARTLIARGAGAVVLSLGEDGLVILTAGATVHARLDEPITGGNPTGAGDAAVAAVASFLHENTGGLQDAACLAALARRAVAWSASAVLMPLAGDLHPDHSALTDRIIVETLNENPNRGAS